MSYSISKNIKILVIGDIMIDHYVFGDCNRISPEAPVQIVEIRSESYTLGGAGNVVKNIQAFGVKADIISVIGEDDNAEIVINQLGNYGIDNHGLIKDSSRCTTIKSRVLVSNHQLIRLDREVTKPLTKDIADSMLNVLNREIKKFDIVLLSDYNKGLLSNYLLENTFAICKKAGVKTILDPKGLDFKKYKGVNIIKPNKKEASAASGILIIDNETLGAACKKIKQHTDCDDVIITLSEDGIAVYSEDKLTIIPTKVLDVVDVTGAGDTVLASLGVVIASGGSLKDACDFANSAAAVVVSKVGSATATVDEVEQKLKRI